MDLQIGDIVTINGYNTKQMLDRKAIYEILVINPTYISLKQLDNNKVVRRGFMLRELRKVTPAEKVLFGN